MSLQAWGLDLGDEEPVELSVDLTFTSGREYLLQGVDGCMPCVDGLGSRYYSIPDIQIGQTSKLTIGDREVEIVRGQFWMDHQWGFLSGQPPTPAMRAAGNITEPEPLGWDWFMAQFVGNRQITMAAPHRKSRAEFYQQTGDTPPGTMSVKVGGTYLDENMNSTIVFGTLDVDGWIKTRLSPNPDRYPATHTWYPNHWTFHFDQLPDDIADFSMTPVVDTGQAAFFANGAQISEGAVFLHDPDANDVGRGFAESVMYADSTRNQLRIVGLPDTDEMVDLVTAGTPGLLTRLTNLLYVFTHKKELKHVFDEAKGLEFFPSD